MIPDRIKSWELQCLKRAGSKPLELPEGGTSLASAKAEGKYIGYKLRLRVMNCVAKRVNEVMCSS